MKLVQSLYTKTVCSYNFPKTALIVIQSICRQVAATSFAFGLLRLFCFLQMLSNGSGVCNSLRAGFSIAN